ncbi:hypothetical protein ACHABQ_05465 [Nesterenkonia aurantiaca]|uniref:hypothetical protein n=1 Tax=Nesterenkonia aurantiaca TaxID=1436010 RepID=UPI003EE59A01
MASEVEQLTKEVRAKRRINEDKIADRLLGQLDQIMDKKIKASGERFEAVLRDQEARMEAQSAKGASEARRTAEKLTEALQRAEKTAKKVKTGLTWWGLGRVAMLLLPPALILLTMSLVGGTTAYALGLGPLTEWVWGSFADIEPLWGQGLFVLLFLGILAGIAWAVKVLSTKFMEACKGWP